MTKKYAIYVDGQWQQSARGRLIASINPADETHWADFVDASADDVERAVTSAQHAFETGPWPRLKPSERGDVLRRIAARVRDAAETLGRTETTDTGKLYRETRWQAGNVAHIYEFYAGFADKMTGQVPVVGGDGPFLMTLREPLGVVVGIVPWNSQLQLSAFKIAPALAAGNTIVIKGSDDASGALLEFAALLDDVGLPPGVLNVVTGGPECGQAITSHPLVRRIAFTGGVDTARKIIPNAQHNIARLSLELGGKSPVIVFDDADVESVVNGVVAGIFGASGQSCAAGSRLLVHESLYDEVVSRLVGRAGDIRIGDPMVEETQIGPLATKRQRDRIETLLERSIGQGAKLLSGGNRPSEFKKGWYFEPTIVACDHQRYPIVTEELFGPVLSVLRFRSESEVIDMANASRFAFAGGIFTRDIARAMRCVRAVKAGRLWVNTYRVTSTQVPFGGAKESGYGRESGLDALNDYSELKSVMIEISGKPVTDPFIMR